MTLNELHEKLATVTAERDALVEAFGRLPTDYDNSLRMRLIVTWCAYKAVLDVLDEVYKDERQ